MDPLSLRFVIQFLTAGMVFNSARSERQLSGLIRQIKIVIQRGGLK